ncbi:hypothetical protein V1477_014045 [Vespula maculifrons]|uniref:Uncharacterized protein n=1 Tax=Vespula maculifrons TaxID=7453 RepID=A0ABD2BLH1_VESMC
MRGYTERRGGERDCKGLHVSPGRRKNHERTVARPRTTTTVSSLFSSTLARLPYHVDVYFALSVSTSNDEDRDAFPTSRVVRASPPPPSPPPAVPPQPAASAPSPSPPP